MASSDATALSLKKAGTLMGESRGETTQTQMLLDQAAQGDYRAYDVLMARVAERLQDLARIMLRRYPHLRRWEQTDDVFQNAAMRLHRSLKKVHPDSVRDFFGLAALEIRRSLIDLIRHHFGPEGEAAHHQSDFQSSSCDGGPGILQNLPDGGETAGSLEAWSRFHEAVDALPEEDREVMQLGWYAGLKQAEIAGVLGVSVPTVKRRWYRARIRLRTVLEGGVYFMESD